MKCAHCNRNFVPKRSDSRFCRKLCATKFYYAQKPKVTDAGRPCFECGKHMTLRRDQSQKKTCSDKCRRARVARIVREWHLRNPEREALYRERAKLRQTPDANLKRFYQWNPDAPRCCEAAGCAEWRVLEIAHKPGHERNGAWRSKRNCVWPFYVWVLCPTHHRLIDRMHYPPEDFSLTV